MVERFEGTGHNALVIDADPDYPEITELILKRQGIRSRLIRSPQEISQVNWRESHFNLVVLDMEMFNPELEERLREKDPRPGVIILAELEDENKTITLLEEGPADYYILKPFKPRLLRAAITSVMRRYGHLAPIPLLVDRITEDGFSLDLSRNEVSIDGQHIALTTREFSLLCTLLLNRGRPLSRTELVDKAWGYQFEGADREVDVYVARLRRKIEEDPKNPCLLLTDRGRGYHIRGGNGSLPQG